MLFCNVQYYILVLNNWRFFLYEFKNLFKDHLFEIHEDHLIIIKAIKVYKDFFLDFF